MREVLLCKYGELVLKGANRASFESTLVKELKYRLSKAGNFRVHRGQSVIYIEPADDESASPTATEEAYGIACRTFGIAAIARAYEAKKDFADVCRTAAEALGERLSKASTFKVETKRADKSFPMRSAEISAGLGASLLEAFPNLRVDVHSPDVVVKCEIREDAAYVSAGQDRAAGGIPVGTGGRALLLLSGGIDSPVAGWMTAKRGAKPEAVYFEAFPYTSIQAREKVIELARKIARWSGTVKLHVVSLTPLEEALSKNCREEFFTLLLRRSMMRIASGIAKEDGCGALVTGESLGQVASQTMEAIAVTDDAASLPVMRPCIGLDKEEIIAYARKIDTYDTSVLPYEDCCTVFTPRHPKTHPSLSDVIREEGKLDLAAIEAEALSGRETLTVPYDHR